MADKFVSKLPYAVVLVCGFTLGTLPTSGTQANGPAVVEPIKAMEHRFFFRQYTQDPVEKRLERLELLVFGSTQTGTNQERMERLKKTISNRDSQSASSVAGSRLNTGQGKLNGYATPRVPPVNKPVPKTNYPVLNTLEWRVLKKTYPGEGLDERLERLETKIFGQSAGAMSYLDRLERLKRTLGMDVAQTFPQGPLGPAPKAVPRQDVPRSLPFFLDNQSQFAEMFKELNRQMEELMQLPPESHQQPNLKILPPYYDPNSI